MASNRLRLPILLIALLATAFTGCRISYKFNGSALDYTVYKTVSISDFPIRAALVYPPLQQVFENELRNYIDRNTRLQVTDGASDLQLEGEITGYTDNKQEGKDIDQTFSAYRDFPSTEMLTDVQDQLCDEISKELVDLIFNATLGNW